MRVAKLYSKYLKVEVASIACLLLLWEVVGRLNLAPSYLFPSFSNTLEALYASIINGQLTLNYLATLYRSLLGLTLGACFGVLTGLAVAYHETVQKTLYPIVMFLYAVPAVAWIPLFLVWIGLKETLVIAVVFMCSFAPMVYVVLTGIRSTSPSIVKVAQIFGARGFKLLFKVLLPQVLPSILSGLKVEAGMAWRTCFTVEMVAMPSGLGMLAMKAQSIIRVDMILAIILLLALTNYVLQLLIDKVELKILRKWGYVR